MNNLNPISGAVLMQETKTYCISFPSINGVDEKLCELLNLAANRKIDDHDFDGGICVHLKLSDAPFGEKSGYYSCNTYTIDIVYADDENDDSIIEFTVDNNIYCTQPMEYPIENGHLDLIGLELGAEFRNRLTNCENIQLIFTKTFKY